MTVDYDSGVDWDEVVKDYRGYELAVLEVCEKHMLWPPELYKFLHAEGVPLRGRGHRGPPDRKLDKGVCWYLQEVHVRKICKVLGMSSRTLYEELRERGIPLRGYGE